MDDFEQAVESQELPQFLKQDADAGISAPTVGEAELERLIREMSEADLDALAGELGVDESRTKVGLIVPEGELAGADPSPDTTAPAAEAEAEAKRKDKDPETEGVKGTMERIPNPDLELEKKLAEVEVAGPISTKAETEEGGAAAPGAVAAAAVVSKVEDVIVGADKDVPGPGGKEKLD